jgi:Flp pilus assembly protein TadG
MRHWLGRRGSTTLEFALVSLAFLMLLLGTFEVGRYYFTSEAVRTVTAEAARKAMMDFRSSAPSSCPASNSVKTYVTSTSARTPFLGSSQLSLTVTCGTTASGASSITVNVSYPFSSAVSWLAVTTNITDTAYMVIEARTSAITPPTAHPA